jgi:hypothetical protein
VVVPLLTKLVFKKGHTSWLGKNHSEETKKWLVIIIDETSI